MCTPAVLAIILVACNSEVIYHNFLCNSDSNYNLFVAYLMTLSVVVCIAKIENNIFVQAVKINLWKTLRAKFVQQVN
jgi:hypothetical protein